MTYLRKAHRYLYIFNVVFFFCLLYPFLYYYSRKEDRYEKLNTYRRLWGFLSSFFSGIFYRYRIIPQKIDWSKNYIICSNHTSNLDITAISLFVKRNFAFIGKEELLENPFTGLFFRSVDIPLNRSSRISSFKAFKRGGDYLKAGMNLAIFPEGKIPDEYPPVLHSFKNGSFRMAVELKVPVIPVTILDSWEKMWDDGSEYGSRPGICDICVHEPIETSALTIADIDILRDKVYEIINSELIRNEAR